MIFLIGRHNSAGGGKVVVELRHLFGLIAAVLTPMVVCLGTFLVFLDRGADLHAGLELRSAAREVAAQAAAAVGRDIAALTTLASAAALDTADHAAFRAQAERALGNGLGWLGIILADDSRQIVNTRVTGGEEMPPLHLPSDIWRVLQAGRPDLSPVLADRYRFGQPLVAVRVPVVRSGVARYVLIALVPASRFAELLQAQMRGSADRAPGGLLVIDQRDRIVARRGIFSGPEMEVGMPAPAALLGWPTNTASSPPACPATAPSMPPGPSWRPMAGGSSWRRPSTPCPTASWRRRPAPPRPRSRRWRPASPCWSRWPPAGRSRAASGRGPPFARRWRRSGGWPRSPPTSRG
ncbi:hypothetical protein [Azospirillum thermophilum]|uniref:hypothetical protein n=1 Tax=Azospirillum thermophilum TaxID=2202148 RepID=UPI001FE90A11|nr:hypothetical protein [Azospirillum thermophilum]